MEISDRRLGEARGKELLHSQLDSVAELSVGITLDWRQSSDSVVELKQKDGQGCCCRNTGGFPKNYLHTYAKEHNSQ